MKKHKLTIGLTEEKEHVYVHNFVVHKIEVRRLRSGGKDEVVLHVDMINQANILVDHDLTRVKFYVAQSKGKEFVNRLFPSVKDEAIEVIQLDGNRPRTKLTKAPHRKETSEVFKEVNKKVKR